MPNPPDRCPKCGANGNGIDWDCKSFENDGNKFVQSDACRANAAEARLREASRLFVYYSNRGNEEDYNAMTHVLGGGDLPPHPDTERVRELAEWHKRHFPGYYDDPMPSTPVFDDKGKLIGRRLSDDVTPLVGRDAEFHDILTKERRHG